MKLANARLESMMLLKKPFVFLNYTQKPSLTVILGYFK